jgi:hypothetical protein
MYLVPIVCRKLTEVSGSILYQCWLLLERNGTYAMSVRESEEGSVFAAENGLECARTAQVGSILFLEVRPTPSLADFYTWSELAPQQQPMRECWRPFLWSVPDIGGNDGLKEIEIGPSSVFSVLESFFGSKTE